MKSSKIIRFFFLIGVGLLFFSESVAADSESTFECVSNGERLSCHQFDSPCSSHTVYTNDYPQGINCEGRFGNCYLMTSKSKLEHEDGVGTMLSCDDSRMQNENKCVNQPGCDWISEEPEEEPEDLIGSCEEMLI
jgi:hypothetical protein